MLIGLGYALGFRFAGLPEALAAVAIAVWAGFSISWMSAALASALRNAEAVQMVNMLWLFPMMFASSLFVPTETMPGWLQPIANNQPISVITDAARSVSDGTAAAGEVLSALAWMTGLMVVFMFLAVRQFNRQT
jgi:ABC transporter DrrB family efflux protein